MADVIPQGFVNFGLSQAQQGQAQASTNLMSQQTQAAQMANMRTAAALPMIMKMLRGGEGQITNFDGQTNGHGTSDAAGSDYDSGSDTSGAVPQGQASVNKVTGYDLVGRNAQTSDVVQQALQSKYNIDPSGTQQEQAAIMQAYTRKMQIDLLGDEGLSKMAADQLNAAIAQRDMGVKSRLNAAHVASSQEFEGLSSVSTSDHPFNTLQAVNPMAAARLKASMGGDAASMDQLDAAAKSQADRSAGFLHRFTGREIVVGDDKVSRDKDTQQPIPGVAPQGFSAEGIEKIREEGDKLDTVYRNGRETQIPHREAVYGDGVTSNDYVQRRVAEIRAVQASQNRAEQQRQIMVSTQAAAGVPPDQRIPSPGQKTPPSRAAAKAAAALQPSPKDTSVAAAEAAARQARGNGQPGAAPAQPGAAPAQPGATPASTQRPAPPPAAAPAPAPPNSNTLTPAEQAYVRGGPGPPAFLNTGRGKPNPQEEASQKDYAASRTTLLAEADADRQAANATLTQVSRGRALLAKDPITGPGAQTLATIQTMWQNMTGQHAAETIESNAAIYQLMLKTLGQDQLGNMLGKLHAEGASVRLGAQESKLILGALSANPDLSKGAIAQMLQWEESDANYKLARARTAKAWVAANRDPQQFNYETQFPQAQNSQTSLGLPPQPAAAAATKPKYSDAQVRAYMQQHKLTDEAATRRALGL